MERMTEKVEDSDCNQLCVRFKDGSYTSYINIFVYFNILIFN